jgi:hypothetical protein
MLTDAGLTALLGDNMRADRFELEATPLTGNRAATEVHKFANLEEAIRYANRYKPAGRKADPYWEVKILDLELSFRDRWPSREERVVWRWPSAE